MNRKQDRDIEKGYTPSQFAAKLRRLADAVEHGKRFEISISGERLSIPAGAAFTIEHEREGKEEEVEFQIKWTRK